MMNNRNKGRNHPRYNKECHKKHYCIEQGCNNEISYVNWRDGKQRCRSCAMKARDLNLKGKNNPNFKGGKVKVKCSYCDKVIERFPSLKFKFNFCNKKCKGKWQSINLNNENNPNYIDGKSKEPYSLEFNDKLRNKIRKRDNYICQGENCRMTQEEHFIVYGRDIEIHHIDYNKDNCNETNLITLCKQCNMRANFNRDYWENYFKNKLKGVIHNGQIISIN